MISERLLAIWFVCELIWFVYELSIDDQRDEFLDKRLFFLLNMAQRKLFNHVDQVCEEQLDASVTQLAALIYICKHTGCVQKDLTVALGLKKPAVTGLISRMEKNNLLQRKPCADDARAMRLYPTAQGIEKANSLAPYIQQLNQQFEAHFSQDEIATVLKFLNFILKRF